MPTHRKKSTAKKVYPSPLSITPTQLNNDLCLQYAYLYAKPKRQQRMDTKTVCQMQELIGVKMREPDGNILDDAFITNFRLLKDIDANIFRSMTKTLFKALVSQPIRYPFLTKLTTEWLEYANHTSMATKERFFMENLSIFQTMAQFIPKIGCYSLQVRILKIIFSHLKSPQEYVKVLFKPLIEDHPHGIFCRLESYNTLSDRQKQIIMYRDIPNDLNKKAKRVFSKVMRYLYFDNKAIAPYPSHEGFSDWNLGTKTIEFSLNLSGFEAKTMIDSDNLESVQYAIGPRQNQVHEITFTLSEPLNLSCDSNPSLSGRRSVAKVKMMFDTLEGHEVEKLFFKMFPSLATFKKDGKVKMAKPALHTVRDTHMGEVFMSTPPSSPPRPFRKLRGSPKDIDPSEYFKNTEYSIDQDEHQPVQLELKHSDSEVEPPVKANDEPNQKQVTPTRSTKKRTTRKPSKQKQSTKTAVDTVVSNSKKNKAKAENTATIQVYIEGDFATAIRKANAARKAATPKKETLKKETPKKEAPTDVIDLDLDACVNNGAVKQETVADNQKIMVEEYTPRKLRTRSIETRSMATKNSDKIASEKPVHEKEKQTPEKPKRNYKRKSTPVKANDEMEPKSDANVGLDISPDSTTIPAKRMRFQSIEIKDSDDESTNIPEPPQNTEEQFNSLFGGPSCFKGQVQPNANALHKNLLSKVKIKKERSNSSDHITYILSDSD